MDKISPTLLDAVSKAEKLELAADELEGIRADMLVNFTGNRGATNGFEVQPDWSTRKMVLETLRHYMTVAAIAVEFISEGDEGDDGA